MITKVNNHSPFTVKKNELKSGASWHQVAQERFKKQHGDVDHIPEGDNHAVPTNNFGPQIPVHSEEELKVAMTSLEEQIKSLQNKDEEAKKTALKEPEKPVKDDFYDDWLNE